MEKHRLKWISSGVFLLKFYKINFQTASNIPPLASRYAKSANVPYLLVVGGAGSLNVAPNLQLVDTPDFPADVYPAANVVRELLNELRTRTDVNWAFLSPAAMFAINPVSFERTGIYRVGGDDMLLNADGTPADISVADLAVAIADDVESKGHLFKRFTVAQK